MSGLRYVAQRYGTWEILYRELDWDADGPEWRLSSYGVMRATVEPERAHEVAADGHPVIWPWGTLIHAEVDDRRLWTGIVTEVEPDGASLVATVVEWPGYLDGLIWTTRIRAVQTDPADILRDLLGGIQTYRTGRLGITVTGATPVRLGSTSEDDALQAAQRVREGEAAVENAKQATRVAKENLARATKEWNDLISGLEKTLKSKRDAYAFAVSSKQAAAIINARRAEAEGAAVLVGDKQSERDTAVAAERLQVQLAEVAEDHAKAELEARRQTKQNLDDQVRQDGGAWKILGDDLPDCWDAIEDLIRASGIELTTHTTRTEGMPILEWRVHHPSVGRRRDDLLFQQGVNVISELKPEPKEYASEVVGVGAGEGEHAIRAITAEEAPRLRRNITNEDKRIGTVQELTASNRELLKKSLRDDFPLRELTVMQHENALIGSWELGDLITVHGEMPHIGTGQWLCRIRGWRYVSDSRAVIYVEGT